MKNIKHASARNQPAANNAYIGAQLKIDECIARLKEIRASQADCKHWAHAEGAVHCANDLVDAVNALTKETC